MEQRGRQESGGLHSEKNQSSSIFSTTNEPKTIINILLLSEHVCWCFDSKADKLLNQMPAAVLKKINNVSFWLHLFLDTKKSH